MSRQNIIDASGLVGLALVFVFGYFAALFPAVETLLARPKPEIKADRVRLATEIRGRMVTVAALFVLDIVVVTWLAPLSTETVRSLSFDGPFPTVETGLLVMDLMLVTLLLTTGLLMTRMRRRRREMLNCD